VRGRFLVHRLCQRSRTAVKAGAALVRGRDVVLARGQLRSSVLCLASAQGQCLPGRRAIGSWHEAVSQTVRVKVDSRDIPRRLVPMGMVPSCRPIRGQFGARKLRLGAGRRLSAAFRSSRNTVTFITAFSRAGDYAVGCRPSRNLPQLLASRVSCTLFHKSARH